MNPGGGINRGESGTAATRAAYASGGGRQRTEGRGTSLTVLVEPQSPELIGLQPFSPPPAPPDPAA